MKNEGITPVPSAPTLLKDHLIFRIMFPVAIHLVLRPTALQCEGCPEVLETVTEVNRNS